ncbi:hypothetical protein NEHOM01_1062 [Nematocida homosporus]|uniref:uncharacterized protein n=1 Tax=Nematocida homosporus TaxID=1912981 RepID=UPI00221F95B9|nr:uncharacterized protein NEHOM01_1062 [Nematocida homosporus]KAI5185785.1 hypothetical protein NEHOM01_1062 [Nematocida homosporus]
MAYRKNSYIKIIALIVIVGLSVLLIYAGYLIHRTYFAQNTPLFQSSQPPQFKVISQVGQTSSTFLQSFILTQYRPPFEFGPPNTHLSLSQQYKYLNKDVDLFSDPYKPVLTLLLRLLIEHSQIPPDSNKDRQGGEFRNKIEELFPIGKWKNEIPTDIEERYMYVWIEFIRISSAYFARVASLDDLIEINQQLAKIKDSTQANSPEREQQTIQAAKRFIATTTKTHGRMEDIDRYQPIIQRFLRIMKVRPYFQNRDPFNVISANIGFLDVFMHFMPISSRIANEAIAFLTYIENMPEEFEEHIFGPIRNPLLSPTIDLADVVSKCMNLMERVLELSQKIWEYYVCINPTRKTLIILTICKILVYPTERLLSYYITFEENMELLTKYGRAYCDEIDLLLETAQTLSYP